MAVLVIQFASVQHSFWVVLATLSVLRSNAFGTGATVFSAVAGTVIGIVVGGALIYAIGTDERLLWVLLPPAVLLAAYAPRAISFAAGQAGFTVVLLIVFNIIVPTGWQLGLLRVEDVAIGCAISLAVGVLFWPRGAETLVRARLSGLPTPKPPTTWLRRVGGSQGRRARPGLPSVRQGPRALLPTVSTTPFASTLPSLRRAARTWTASWAW